MSATISQRIQENYTIEAMVDRVTRALERAGLGTGPLQWSDLVTFDQFHVRGLDATKELAADLKLKNGQTLLDVGSGLGGPARYLAAVHAVHVTGIDLTPDFIEISNFLSQRAGLTDKLTFIQGDAIDLPFLDEEFDVVWTQHVAMNIPDKAKLYKGFYRVLKSGGRLAMYDAVKGNDQPILYPTPWASEGGISFVASEGEIKEALADANFKNHSCIDKTDGAAQWSRELLRQREQPPAQAPNPLSLSMILGPQLGPAIVNFARNVLEGRLRIVQIIADKV